MWYLCMQRAFWYCARVKIFDNKIFAGFKNFVGATNRKPENLTHEIFLPQKFLRLCGITKFTATKP